MVMVFSPTNGVVVLLEENIEQSKPSSICSSNQEWVASVPGCTSGGTPASAEVC